MIAVTYPCIGNMHTKACSEWKSGQHTSCKRLAAKRKRRWRHTLSWTSCKLATTTTFPVALTGLISCQAPSSAAALNPGSMALRMRLTAKAGPPRTTSSAKSSTAQSSTLKALPKALEIGCSLVLTASLVSEMALLIRSITAVACKVQRTCCCYCRKHCTRCALPVGNHGLS